MARQRVVIVGAGFAGLAVMRGLKAAPVDVDIVDRHNYHLFQPLLYQVASSLLDASAIAFPVRAVARHQHNARFHLADVSAVDLEARTVTTSEGELPYDYLVVATGARSNFFGINGLEHRAFGLKTLDEALTLRARVLEQFEIAAQTSEDADRRRRLTFCIAGAGPSGVEYAGALSELIRLVLRREYREIDFSEVRVVLVEAKSRVLETFVPKLGLSAEHELRQKGVDLLLGRSVRAVDDAGVHLDNGDVVAAATVVWTAGVTAGSMAQQLTPHTGSLGRVPVDSRLRLPAHHNVFVLGDLAESRGESGNPLPMLGGVAVQQGEYAAKQIAAVAAGRTALEPFHYVNKGTMATVGRNAAVVEIGPFRYAGRLGWLTWLFVHLMLLVGFRNRLAALWSWGWDYVFYDRPVRLITRQTNPKG